MQNFVPQSRVGIFRDESTRSNPLDLKLTFWCVSYHLGAFETIWLPYETRCKTGRTSAKVHARSHVGIFRNERTQSIPLDAKLMFWCVSYHWVHSGPFGCLTKLGGKQADLVQKFVPRSCVRVFRNKRNRSTPFDPKLTIWCIS